VYYTAGNALAPISRISRFTSTDNGATLDPASEEILLSQDQPFSNHNGGTLRFGGDGYLYFGFGDGGSGGDPFGNGQDPFTLLGKMIRIDVDSGSPYDIPADNPFASGADALPEIWATGLRNPWRWSFDEPTGQMWVADVGQNEIEEVNLVERGGNYGWNVMEGDECYGRATCDQSGLLLPLETTLHSEGNASITGRLRVPRDGDPGPGRQVRVRGLRVRADLGARDGPDGRPRSTRWSCCRTSRRSPRSTWWTAS
jgi:glucose/arabinose dehydrogenase